MVRLKAPMLSLEAHGTLANILNFSSNNGRAYARKKPTPTNNRQKGQLPTRAAMSFLSKSWSMLTPDQQATWTNLLQDKTVSPYNTYLKLNNLRILDGKAPTIEYPAAELTYTALPVSPSYTKFHSHVELRWRLSANMSHWSISLYRRKGTTSSTQVPDLIKIIHPEEQPNFTIFRDTPPSPGNWTYLPVAGSLTGSRGPTFFTIQITWP